MSGRRWPRRTAALAFLCAAAAASADERGDLFIGLVPVDGRVDLSDGRPIEVTLRLQEAAGRKPTLLDGWFPAARAAEGALRVRLPAVLASGAPVLPRHRQATFLVDFDEPPVAALREALAALPGTPPSIEALTAFVDRHVVKKDLKRVFDPASVVARRREGDCTEHAVLLAAVARLVGRPARVVMGLALVPQGDGVLAAGHAWTEIHDGTAWRTADAVPLPPATRRLPFAEVADEGPGFAGALWEALSPLDVRAVALAPAP